MATKKPNKKTSKKDIVLDVKYCVELPYKVLQEVLTLGCAKKLDEFGQSFAESLESLNKSGGISNEMICEFKHVVEALAATTVVLDIIEDTWSCKQEKFDDKCKKHTGKKEKNPACKAEKKQTAGGILTIAEKTAIKQLRNKGLSIKAIGKSIKRGEKVVANYVHYIEKTKKRK